MLRGRRQNVRGGVCINSLGSTDCINRCAIFHGKNLIIYNEEGSIQIAPALGRRY